MLRYRGGKLAHLLVWHVLILWISISSWPLPTIHEDLANREEDAPEDVAGQPVVTGSAEDALDFSAGIDSHHKDRSVELAATLEQQPAPPLPEAAQRNDTRSRQFRYKWRRIKALSGA